MFESKKIKAKNPPKKRVISSAGALQSRPASLDSSVFVQTNPACIRLQRIRAYPRQMPATIDTSISSPAVSAVAAKLLFSYPIVARFKWGLFPHET
jgi:hypothetical protein